MKICGVYAIKNKINGKLYIGSSNNIRKRFYNHKNLLINNKHYNIKLQRAWNKNGENNFEFYILEETSTNEIELREAEQKHLDLNNSYSPKSGYNISKKADCPYGNEKSGEFLKIFNKTKRKPIIQYNLDGEFIKEWESLSEAAKFYKIKVSSIFANCKRRIKTVSGFVWRYKSEIENINTKIPINEIKNSCTKPILQYDLEGNFIKEWESTFLAGKTLNISLTMISNVCTGKNKTGGGFFWKHKNNEEIIQKIEIKERQRTWKPVLQYDLEGNFIKEWRSITDASIGLNIKTQTITRCCKNLKTKTEFIWKFKNKQ
jgi:group I intron endonuclease